MDNDTDSEEALLQGLSEETFNREVSNKGTLKPCIYDDGYDSGQVSLLWGENEGFRRRVSRAVNSMPGTSSSPFRPRSIASVGQDSVWPWAF